jgi:hypothetical protein
MITCPKEYLNLDDTILHEIRLSDEEELQEARDLLKRFDGRKHYSFCGEKVLSEKVSITESDVLKFKDENSVISERDFAVRLFSVNMGMKDQHPLKHVTFYKQVTP